MKFLLFKVTVLASLMVCLLGCSVLFTYPNKTTAEERLSAFPSDLAWPIDAPINVYWNEQMIPFVEAQTDNDGAFAIGVVHAHLRLGQMEMFRRLSQGRVAEMGGPIALADIDLTIRTLGLDASARASLTTLSTSDGEWLAHYVRGINFFIANSPRLPLEYEFLGLEIEPWTEVDVLRLSRLGGADPNWFTLLRFLSLQDQEGWQSVWNTYLKRGMSSPTSFAADPDPSFASLVNMTGRVGSNSVVVGEPKREGRGALIASDPHLGIFVPNLWLLMGYKTPSYHVLGYMLPGAPATVIGRNKEVAWGGTAMRSVSSHLFELDKDEPVEQRTERIKRRWWFAKKVTVETSSKGPVVSNLPGQDGNRRVALWWEGYEPSNELGSFLAASRSSNWEEFREAFADYAVGGLNVTYADHQGNIGMLLGVRQPRLADESEYFDLVKSTGNAVIDRRGPSELPTVFNPSQGYIASANNMPAWTTPPVAFVSGESARFRRWSSLLSHAPSVSIEDLMVWQNDVFVSDALDLKTFMVERFSGDLNHSQKAHWARLQSWDGYYDVDSAGAPVFELLTLSLATTLLEQDVPNQKLSRTLLDTDDWRTFLQPALRELDDEAFNSLIQDALAAVERDADRFQSWGDMHVQPMRYPLGLIPVLGNRFRYFEYPSPGSSSTINKAGFGATEGKRSVTFGAQARHISDLSDMNENYFVMHGGNDGWLDNENMLDQLETWRNGDYYRIPMAMDDVREEFSRASFTMYPSPSTD